MKKVYNGTIFRSTSDTGSANDFVKALAAANLVTPRGLNPGLLATVTNAPQGVEIPEDFLQRGELQILTEVSTPPPAVTSVSTSTVKEPSAAPYLVGAAVLLGAIWFVRRKK